MWRGIGFATNGGGHWTVHERLSDIVSLRRQVPGRSLISLSVKSLGDASVLIASHEVFEDGAPQALEAYLAPRTASTEILLFPFKGVPDERIGRRVHRNGRLVSSRRYRWSAPAPHELLAWLRDIAFLTVRLLSVGRKIDLFIGVDPLNCAAGIILRRLKVTNAQVIYYTIDYVPKRFGNERLNRFYHGIDEFCSRRADVIWNVSAEIAEARAERSGAGKRGPEVVVPIGVHQVTPKPQSEPSTRLVYLGILLEKQGLQYVIPALPLVAQKIPGIHLDIIGSGPYEDELKRLAEEHGVSDRVNFGGYVKENAEIQRQLTKGGLGIATYDDDPNSFTRFADPSKLKAYLAAGLPILVTDVPVIARFLVDEGCATIVEPAPESIATGIESVLADGEAFTKQAAAACRIAHSLLWTQVFDDAFAESRRNKVLA